MKRIFTLLFVILVSIPSFGQLLRPSEQESTDLKTHRIFNLFKSHHEKINDYHTQSLRIDFNKRVELLKSTALENKTLDSLISEEYDSQFNSWRAETKEQFTYDSNGKINTEILSYWNHQNADWQPLQKFEYVFNDNGNLTSIISSFQYIPNQWSFIEKYDYTYNENGNLTSETSFAWNSNIGSWVNSYKYELTYNMAQQIILHMGYEWNFGANQWGYMNKNEYFYTMGVLSSEIASYWNYGTNDWEYNSKSEYFYETMAVTKEILYRWETNPSGIWVEESKYEYDYELGSVSLLVRTNETDYIWDEGTNGWDWEPKYKSDYQYDNRDNLTAEIYYSWNSDIGQWIEDNKGEYIFDLTYELSDLTVPFFYNVELSYNINNMLIGYRGYEFENSNWVDTDKLVLYYSDYTNPLNMEETIIANSIKVYPNPVNQILTIDSNIPINKVELFSLLGKKVKDVTNDFKTIPVNDLSNGIYIVKIQSGNHMEFRKIIKNN
jgi:hypothetical protein